SAPRPAGRAAAAPRTGPRAVEKKHTVTLIPGDGVGEDLADQVVKVIQATGVSIGFDRQLSGRRAQAKSGSPLPESLFESVRKNKVALKGVISTPIGAGYESPNVQLRKRLGLFASIRPVRNLPGLKARYENVDLVVIRENTEDMYSGIEHEVVPGVVQSVKVVTEQASLRIARAAFEYATRHGRKSVACVHKANIMKQADGLFLDCFRRVAGEFPSIRPSEVIADAACMQLVLDPYRFDVLVMGNLYGDIISDVCSGLVGGAGAVPGINVGEDLVVFEATHGDAPELEGRDAAGPLPLLVPAVHMLRHLGEAEAADRIMKGLGAVLADGSRLTRDLGGDSATSAMIEAVVAAMPPPVPAPGA
ncbi:MAG TPA: isocitrate/isopropylmalate family dehydrogenase, partial [Candidatus Saccharimonadales bacterium]|nr:isocitrate/isopropylmalate family dehydrogenase [Candidatus Saccharimonadales bacterium]